MPFKEDLHRLILTTVEVLLSSVLGSGGSSGGGGSSSSRSSNKFKTATTKRKMTTTTTMKISIAMCIVYLSGLGMLSILHDSSSSSSSSNSHSELQKSLDDFRRPKSPISEIHVLSLLESKFDIFQHRNLDLDTTDDMNDNDDDDDDENDEQGGEAMSSSTTTKAKAKTKTTSSSSSATTIEWFPAYDGMDQSVLNEWSQITNLKLLNATDFFGMDGQKRKDGYASPHAVGCYLSHWRVLEKAWKSWKGVNKATPGGQQSQTQTQTQTQQRKRKRRRPDMLFVFEDDAHCVSNVIERTWKVVRQLPKDWDILYIGGKPMSYYTMGRTLADFVTGKDVPPQTNDVASRPSDQELIKGMCRGDYGTSISGPFAAPTITTTTTSNSTAAAPPPYWQVKYILNTNAYVVNPKRIRRILRVLSKPMYEYKPIDVILADDMFREFLDPINGFNIDTTGADTTAKGQNSTSSTSAPLKAFLTPNMYCDQEVKRSIVNRDRAPDWEGYHWLPWRPFKSFPDVTGYVWGNTASEKMCV